MIWLPTRTRRSLVVVACAIAGVVGAAGTANAADDPGVSLVDQTVVSDSGSLVQPDAWRTNRAPVYSPTAWRTN